MKTEEFQTLSQLYYNREGEDDPDRFPLTLDDRYLNRSRTEITLFENMKRRITNRFELEKAKEGRVNEIRIGQEVRIKPTASKQATGGRKTKSNEVINPTTRED